MWMSSFLLKLSIINTHFILNDNKCLALIYFIIVPLTDIIFSTHCLFGRVASY
jgi:hypothetical protein